MGHSLRLQTITVGVCALAFAVATLAQSPASPSAKPDGLVHTELSLLGRTVSVSYAPGLNAKDPALSGRVRVGELQTNGALRIGDVSIGKPAAKPLLFDLFLETAGNGSWQLNVVPAGTAADVPATAGKVALALEPSRVEAPMLVAALVPVERDTAQLVLTWNRFKATAGIQFQEVQPPRPAGGGRGLAPVNRTHDEENVGARPTMLSQLNETALVDASGSRVSITFARTFPRGTPSQSAAGTTRRPGPVVDGPDFARLLSTRDGAVVELTEAPALRLSIDSAVRSGNLVLRSGNHTAGFPGAYSLWLKRAGSRWRLVFNREPDVWGTQHDPKSDVGEIDLTYGQGGEANRPLGVALVPTAADRWRLVLAWGPHEWTADFAAAR